MLRRHNFNSLGPAYCPVVNRGDYFGRRLQRFWMPVGGTMVDVSLNQFFSNISGTTIHTILPDAEGNAYRLGTSGGNNAYTEYDQNFADFSEPYTFVIRAKMVASSSIAYDRIWHSNGNNSGNSRVGCLVTGSGDATPNRLYWLQISSGGTAAETASVAAMSTTEYETYTATMDGSNLNIYRGEVFQSQVACTTYPSSTLTNTIKFGDDLLAGDNGAAVNVKFVGIFRGAFTAPEVKKYAQDPWQIFQPVKSAIIYSFPSSSVPIANFHHQRQTQGMAS